MLATKQAEKLHMENRPADQKHQNYSFKDDFCKTCHLGNKQEKLQCVKRR